MSQFRNLFVEFSGDPSNDKELYKRYCSSEKFEPLSLSDEVIHFVEIAALEAAQREIENLKKENYEIRYERQSWMNRIAEAEYVEQSCLEQLKMYKAALKVAEDALRTAVGHEPFEGLEPRKCSEALAEIQKIKKGLG